MFIFIPRLLVGLSGKVCLSHIQPKVATQRLLAAMTAFGSNCRKERFY
jgi:hypothetical protein